MSTIGELAPRLQELIDRYNAALDVSPDADRTEILSTETAALRRDLLVAALTDQNGQVAELDGVDVFPFWVAAWAAVFRDNAFATAGDETSSSTEGANAMRLSLVVDLMRPDQVPSHQRAMFDFMTTAGTVLDLPYRERELAEVFLSDGQADLASLDVAVGVLRRSIERDAIGRAEQWNALMRALWRRYRLSSNMEDVTAAVDAAERTLAMADGANRVVALHQIGVMEQERFDRTGEPASLRRCMTALSEALDLTPANGPERAAALVGLGIAMRTRGARERSPEDLTRAVALTREALSDQTMSQPHRASALSMLALALHARFELTRNEPDLIEALAVAREAADIDVDEDRAVRLGNLGLILGTRHHHSRDRDGLAELVDVAWRAVVLPGDRHQHGIALGLLSIAFAYQAEASGRLEDLNSAIETARGAVAALSEHSDRALHLHNLAKGLLLRYEQIHSTQDLDESIDVARLATAVSMPDDSHSAGRLSLLAAALERRYKVRQDINDLMEAAAAAEAAVLRSPGSSAEFPVLLSSLSNVRRTLAERTQQLTDVDAAIEVAERALSVDGHVPAMRPVRLFNLGSCHVARFRTTDDLVDIDRAIRLLREALVGLPRQERQLRIWNPLITSAAAWAVEVGRPDEAVELLEEGRGVLWAHQLGRRIDLSALLAVRPDLAERLDEIRQELDA